MKIEPKNGPNVVQPPNSQASARERAIAMIQKGTQSPQQQEPPVASPTSVSAEEVSAISSSNSQEQLQNDTSETVSTDEQAKAASTAPKVDPLSTQYANLARKEKALRAKVHAEQSAAKAREEALAAREEALKAKEAEYLNNYIPKSRFKQDPMSVLTEEGVSYDEITRSILNPQAQQDPRIVAEIDKLKAELQEQRKQQEQGRKAYEEQQQRAYQQAVSEIRTETRNLVNTNPEFETIRETRSVDDVVDLIEKTYHKDGILLSVEEAAKEVEDYLVEEATKLAKIGKIQSRLQAAEKASTPTQKQTATTSTQNAQQPQMKTLTNSVNASKKLSARERAIAAFKGQKS